MSQGRNTTTRDKHRAIIKRGHPPCWICGQDIDYQAHHLDPRSYVVDHVTPIAAGGTDTLDNKRAAHRACNRTKGAKPPTSPSRHVTFTTSRTW